MTFATKLGSRLLPILSRRGFCTTVTRNEVHPVYAKMKETSKLYQINNGLPVSIRYLYIRYTYFTTLSKCWKHCLFAEYITLQFLQLQVHEKRGASDRVMMYTLEIGAIVVMAMVVQTIYTMSWPQPVKEDWFGGCFWRQINNVNSYYMQKKEIKYSFFIRWALSQINYIGHTRKVRN